MKTQIILVLILIITLLNVDVLCGDYIIDQSWERPNSPYIYSAYSIRNTAPLGQEFTPSVNIITGAAISIKDCSDSSPSGIATIEVKIRNNTIDGSIVTSASLTLENPTYEWWYFDFGDQVPIIPGNLYVIDTSIIAGSDFWSWNSWEDSDNIGLPGRLIHHGIPCDDDWGAFGFRTYTIPEPATFLLFGLGGLALRRCSGQALRMKTKDITNYQMY